MHCGIHLLTYLSSMFWEKVTNTFLYIYTHIQKSASEQAHIPREVFWLCQEWSPPPTRQTYFFQTQEDIIREVCADIQKPEIVMVRWGDELTGGWRPLSSLLSPSFPEKPQGEEKAPTEHKAQRTRKGLGVKSKERKDNARDIAEVSKSWKSVSRLKDQVVSSLKQHSGFNFYTRLLHKITLK